MRASSAVLLTMVIISLLPAGTFPGVSAYPLADGSPFDWVYDNVKALDGHDDLWYWYNDGDDLARDLIAFYYSENPDTIAMRIDLMELEVGEEASANWYILMDFAYGGQNALPDGLTDSSGNPLYSGMSWDLAIAVYDSGNYRVYFPDGSIHNDVLKAIALNAEYDFIEVELYKDKIPNFPSGGQVHFQVVSAKDFSSPYRVVDSMPDDLQYYFTSDDRVGTAKVAFVHHGNQHIAYSESDICGGVGTGYDEVLRVHDEYKVPVSLHLSGVLLENLVWNNYTCGDMNFLSEIKKGVAEGWIDLLTSAYGQHIMPFFPGDLNVKSIGLENALLWHLFSYNPKIAWVPERVWETKMSDGDPYNGVKSDPWEYFEAIDPADGEPYVMAVILDEDTHGSDASNTRKIYKLPDHSLRVFFIDNVLKDDTYGDMLKVKKHLLDYALNPDQEQVLLYADDWEKAAGVANWQTSPDAYKYLVRYVAAHPWIQAEKLITYLSWNLEGGWGYGGEYWPRWGTYSQIGGLSGYGGTGDVNGDGSADRNAWYKDWAINYYPFNCSKSAGALWWDAYQELEALKSSGVDNNLVEMAWTTLLANLYETGWHDGLGGPLSGWEKEITSHLRHALPYAYGAWWLSGDRPLLAYWKNVDGDNDDEIVIQNDRIYAVLDPIGGRIGWLFDSSGHVVVGNSMALWSGTEGDYNDANHVWALSDSGDGTTYENDYYQLQILDNGSDGRVLVMAKSPNGFVKYIELRAGWNYLKVTYRNVTGAVYVKSGFSPGLSDLLKNGKQDLERVWLYGGKVAGYYNRETNTLGAYVIPGPVSFNRGEDWRILSVVDEIKLETDGTFYLYAGPWNASVFGSLLSEPLRGRVGVDPAVPESGGTITVYYNATGGPLEGSSQIYLHWGHDGWEDVVDTAMVYENGLWRATIQTSPGWGSLDLAFTDGFRWDNNGGLDYHVFLKPASVPAKVLELLTGDEVNWGSYLPAPNSGEIRDGEYVWHDAEGDVHSTKNYPHPGGNYDIESVRVRADGDYVYFSIRFSNLTSLGKFGAPIVAIPINAGTGTNTTVPYDGSVIYSPGWNYWVTVDLSKTGFGGSILMGYPAVEVYNSSFDLLKGDYYVIASSDSGVVQVALPRALLGGGTSISFNVLVFIGDGRGGALDPGSPRVVELLGTEDTDAELVDYSVDYAPSVDLTAVPFFGAGRVSALLVFLLMGLLRKNR